MGPTDIEPTASPPDTAPITALQVISPAGFYGAERWVLALAGALPRHGVRCELAVLGEDPAQGAPLVEACEGRGIAVHRIALRGRFDSRAIGRLGALAERRGAAVLHSHGYKSDLACLAARRLCRSAPRGRRPALVSTPHGFGDGHGLKMRLYHRIGLLALRRFDRVVPLSPALHASFLELGFAPPRLGYVANGVDLDEVDAALRRVDRLPLDAPRDGAAPLSVGYFGRLAPGKRLDHLLAAFGRVAETFPHVRLEIIGDGPERAALEARARAPELDGRVRFHGFSERRLELAAGFDLFVMTSASEGIPRSMMEAMALGLPVVAYDIPGVDALVEHEVTGLLAPSGDLESLVRQCTRALAERDLTTRLGRAGRAHIERGFSADAMARAYAAEYAITHPSEPPGPGRKGISADSVDIADGSTS